MKKQFEIYSLKESLKQFFNSSALVYIDEKEIEFYVHLNENWCLTDLVRVLHDEKFKLKEMHFDRAGQMRLVLIPL